MDKISLFTSYLLFGIFTSLFPYYLLKYEVIASMICIFVMICVSMLIALDSYLQTLDTPKY